MADQNEELRSLSLTPTWAVATVMTIFVFVSLIVERSIHRLSFWLKRTHRNPLFQALERMKEELMLLGFISLLLSASSRLISNICIDSKFYSGKFTPCTRNEVEDNKSTEAEEARDHRHLMGFIANHSIRRALNNLDHNTCKQGYEPFVSYEGLEQLHRFIFVMAITHVLYSCLTMLLAIVKIHLWRKWENEAHRDHYDCLTEVSRALTMRRQSTFVRSHESKLWSRNRFVIWLICFLRQFGTSVARADYLTLRRGFITNHHLRRNYDFHNYMIQCMEDEFKTIVGVSAPLWGFVIAFMLFDVNGANLYFWIAAIPIALVLLIGAKLQHIIATLALENAIQECSLKPRDELFWFKKPELLLSLIHFVLFQNAFELATFLWFWWQFGYNSCFLLNHWLVYARLFLGFAGQFLCSYSTLPLYALVTQMGSNYKAALIPRRIRESLHTWKNDVKRNKHHKRHRHSVDGSTTIHTETSTVCSIEEDEQLLGDPSHYHTIDIQMQPTSSVDSTVHMDDRENINRSSSARLLPSSVPSSPLLSESQHEQFLRTMSLPVWRK